MGSGPVLVVPPGGRTSLDWYLRDTPAQERFLARLAEHRTVVLYDRHGCGLSDRNRTDFTSEDDMLDIDAVLEALDNPIVDFFGISWGGNPVLAYAARHPDRVRGLVLYGTYAAGRVGAGEQFEARAAALEALRRSDRELYTKTRASEFFPSGADREMFQSLARMLFDSTSPEMEEQLGGETFDNQSVLRQIVAPALVIHRRGDQVCPFEWGQYLARRLPNARFVPLEGDAHYPWVGDADSVLRPTLEFLTGEVVAASAPVAFAPSGTAIILFADIADSTALTERLGDAVFRDKARELDESLRRAITSNGGQAIEGKLLGDGVLAVFGAAREAIACAHEMHDGGRHVGLPLHVGIHAGDVIRENDNVYGGAVNIASRVASEAAAGETLVSGTVRDLARTSAGVSFEDRGERDLKGVGEPVRLFAVRSA
ncbi:MAG: adenylate/guanylate cyclase domain-containing protein [Dehalococcoidia bacterium]